MFFSIISFQTISSKVIVVHEEIDVEDVGDVVVVFNVNNVEEIINEAITVAELINRITIEAVAVAVELEIRSINVI